MKNEDKNDDNLPLSNLQLIQGDTGDSVFTTVFNNNLAVMLLIDHENDQKIIEANEAACRFYGYNREKFLQLKMGDINTLSFEERQKRMKDAMGKPNSHYLFVHKTSSGVLKDVEVTASPIIVKNKQVMFIIVHDITVQKRVESKLREIQERLGLALEGTNLGLWDWHIETGEVQYDEKWAELIGYTLEELSPISIDTWRDITHPEDLESADKELNRYFTKQSSGYEHESRMKHKNGNWIWVLDRGKVFEWDSKGKPLRMAGTHLDITEKKLTEIKLAESESKFRSFFDSSPLSLWEQDYSDVITYLHSLNLNKYGGLLNYLDQHPETVTHCTKMLKILDVNPTTVKLYEAASKEKFIRGYRKIFTTESFEYYKNKLVSLFNYEPLFSNETIHKTFEGKQLYVKIQSTLLPDLRSLITITDITELKNKEYMYQKLISQSKADTETKEILLREINHRVKNNLSSLIGILYAEKRKSKNTLENKQLDLLNNLINRVKGISIAHDLLSKSSWKPISIVLLSEKIINSLKHLIPSDRSIKTEISQSSVFLDADQSQSMAVLINELFVNSLEHASQSGGTLKIDIKIVEKEGSIYYKYKDNGPGFSKEILALKSFNIGLYLIKNIAEQSLRGKISFKNNNGALVEIQFPGGGQFAEI